MNVKLDDVLDHSALELVVLCAAGEHGAVVFPAGGQVEGALGHVALHQHL